ncbi:hypothetical protein QOT17_016547 [Balamuthia mandrillaris]
MQALVQWWGGRSNTEGGTNAEQTGAMNEISQQRCYHVHGHKACGYFRRAALLGRSLEMKEQGAVKVDVVTIPSEEWSQHLRQKREELKATHHSTCPLVWEGCSVESFTFIGGFTDFQQLAEERHSFQFQQQRQRL